MLTLLTMLPFTYLQIVSYLRVKEGGFKGLKIHEIWVTAYSLEVLLSGKTWAEHQLISDNSPTGGGRQQDYK